MVEDGKVVDLYPEPERMAGEARKVGEDPANVRRFLPRMQSGPKWITAGEGGWGFAEGVELLLSRRLRDR